MSVSTDPFGNPEIEFQVKLGYHGSEALIKARSAQLQQIIMIQLLTIRNHQYLFTNWANII